MSFILSESANGATDDGLIAKSIANQQILQMLEGELVASLVLAVRLVVFLHCVVSEVDI